MTAIEGRARSLLARRIERAAGAMLIVLLGCAAAGCPGARPFAGHRRDAPESRPRRLVELAAHARRLGLQPAGSDRPGERRPVAARVGLAARTRTQPGGAAGARRGDVHPEPPQRRAGGRRGDRGPHLGVPPGVRGLDRLPRFGRGRHADALDRHLRRQDLRQHLRRPHRGASTRRPARWSGITPSPTTGSDTATRAGRSSSTGTSSPG